MGQQPGFMDPSHRYRRSQEPSPAADADIDRYLKLLLAEKKLSDEPFEAVPKIEEKQVDGNPLDPVRVD